MNTGPLSTPQVDDVVVHPVPVPPDSTLANVGPPSQFRADNINSYLVPMIPGPLLVPTASPNLPTSLLSG